MIELLQKSDALAYELFQLKAFDLAYKQCQVSIELDPVNPSIRFNAARSAYYANKYEDAVEQIQVMSLFTDNQEAYKRELALYLPWCGKLDEAFELLKQLPQDDRTKFNLGWHYLADGDILKGMEYLECGRRINVWGNGQLRFPIPKWSGEPLNSNHHILLATEGGFGDEIIFCRFATDISKTGAKVTILCAGGLKGLLSRIEGVSKVETRREDLDINEFDFWAPTMSLPFLMKLEKINGSPYLKPKDSYVSKWAKKFSGADKKIGIRWEGGKQFEHDQRRTLPVKDLVEALKSYGTLISLQKDSGTPCPKDALDLEDELETWEDTIAVISLMDVVVTSCTSITHIAAGLGIPTIVIVPILPYFPWAKEGNKSDWYDSVIVCRQTDAYSWNGPINEAAWYLSNIL